VDLTHEHRDAQPSACCLTWQEFVLPLRQIPPITVVLGMGVSQKTRAQEHLNLSRFMV
jgi:hypothetical protein